MEEIVEPNITVKLLLISGMDLRIWKPRYGMGFLFINEKDLA